MSRRRREFEEASVNLTPMIDVLFVILILFIVVAPLLEMETIELAPGGGLETQGIEKSGIVIQVFANNTIQYNKREVSLKELEELLVVAKRGMSGKPQLFQDKSSSFGTFQMVKHVIERAGFSEMDVILKPS